VGKTIERLARCVLDNQHRLTAVAHEFHWPQCPRTIEVLLKFEFVCEAIDAPEYRVLSVGKSGYERVPIAARIISPQSAEDTSCVSPQNL